MFQTYDDYAEWGEKVYEASGGTVTLFPGSQDVSNMMMMQRETSTTVVEERKCKCEWKGFRKYLRR